MITRRNQNGTEKTEIEKAYQKGYEAGQQDAAQQIWDALHAPPLARIQAALWQLGGKKLQRDD